MIKKDYENICDTIATISPFIRFVGVIGESGNLIAYKRRPDLIPLLNEKNTQYQFSHIAIKTDLEGFFDKNLGEIEFVWEERKKVQTISFAIKKSRVWISIDKKVIRSEMLRIIDSCLPIVKKHSGHMKCPYCEINLDSLSMTDGLKHILEHKKNMQNAHIGINLIENVQEADEIQKLIDEISFRKSNVKNYEKMKAEEISKELREIMKFEQESFKKIEEFGKSQKNQELIEYAKMISRNTTGREITRLQDVYLKKIDEEFLNKK